MLIILEPHGIFLSHFAYIFMLTSTNQWHVNLPCFDRYGIAVQLSGLLRSVSKILITLEAYGIFESNFVGLFISILASHSGMQNGDKGLPSIILACQGIFIKCS